MLIFAENFYMTIDDNERWLIRLEDCIARIPLLRWYYSHVILIVCAYNPTRWSLFLVLLVHICFIALIAFPVYLLLV